MMARRKRGRKRSKKKINVLPLVGTAAAAMTIYRAYKDREAVAPGEGLDFAMTHLTGVRIGAAKVPGQTFAVQAAMNTWTPLIACAIISKAAAKFNMNRHIPFVNL